MKLKVSWCQKVPLAGKVLMVMQIKLKPELFNDIHEDSGSHLGQTMSSVSIQPKLATVGFTGTNGTGTPPTHRKNTK